MSDVTPARQEGRLDPAAMLDSLVGMSHECEHHREIADFTQVIEEPPKTRTARQHLRHSLVAGKF
ncbi:MAG: hypothetical protein ACREV8_08745, partial [Gammaproteobacteria bacterium]